MDGRCQSQDILEQKRGWMVLMLGYFGAGGRMDSVNPGIFGSSREDGWMDGWCQCLDILDQEGGWTVSILGYFG